VTTYDDDDRKEESLENGDGGADDGDDNGDGGSYGARKQLQKIQYTLDELDGQIAALRDMLTPTDAPPGPLAEFLRKLETNAGLRTAWIQNPNAVIEASGLPSDDKAALKTGGIDAVDQRLADEGQSNLIAFIKVWVKP
jgi:hypothetical protein